MRQMPRVQWIDVFSLRISSLLRRSNELDIDNTRIPVK